VPCSCGLYAQLPIGLQADGGPAASAVAFGATNSSSRSAKILIIC
jgi:hypothetical protein